MKQSIPILLYHSVSDTAPHRFRPWTVTRRQFAAHLDRLVELGYCALTVGQLHDAVRSGRSLPQRTVVITFDDGLEDFATNAWPELSDRGLPATLYVTAGVVGATSEWLRPIGAGELPMLDAAQIVELVEAGVELGAHSMTHPQLDCVPTSVAYREIVESKQVLEGLAGVPVTSFAYPHGYHNRRVKELVKGAGYSSASAVRNRLSHIDDDPFALARITVTHGHDVSRLDRILRGAEVGRAEPKELWRTAVWRQVRRRRTALMPR